jgi:septal ring factor EnvC (AmiA/AmiB activator)
MSDNGEQREARLRRLEQEHEEFQRNLRQLLTAQVLQKNEIDKQIVAVDKLAKALEAERTERPEKDALLDQRVDNLVSSIADLIRRIPPESLR